MQKNPFDQFDDAGASNPFNTFTTNRDPLAVRRDERADRADARASEAAMRAATAADRSAVNDAARLDLERQRVALAVAEKNGPKLTAAERADAIAGYKSSQGLDRIVAELERLYAQGPGATSGIKGVQDYFPSTINKRFNAAGNAARGYVGTALGFTGGQLNTAAEAAAAVGPYLPQAGDYDSEILDKIQRLKQLSQDAKSRSVQILGGTPDANGVVTPVSAAPEQRKSIPGAVATGRFEAASGANRQERDPVASAIIDRMVRQGSPLDTINTTLANLGYNPVEQKSYDAVRAHFKANPNFQGSYGDATRTAENTTRQQISGSAPGAFAANAFNDVAAGIPGAIFGTDTLEAQRRANPNAALAGSIVGGAIGSGAMELGLGRAAARLGGGLASRFLANPLTADALYGGIQGGATDGSVTGALTGAGLGAAGGAVGRGVVRGIGAATRGVTDPAVQYLRSVGVPLTGGQAVGNSGLLGRTVKGVEDAMTSVPIIGDIVGARRMDGILGFNRAGFDQALAPINASTNGLIGEAGVDAARAARSRAYSATLDPVRVQADAPFVSDMRATIAAGQALPDPMSSNLGYTLPVRVGNSFDASGNLTGRDFQQSVRGLRRDAKAVENLPYGYDFGQVTRQAEGALEGLLQRQAPDVLPAYQAANVANRNVEVLRDAVNRARNGSRSGEVGAYMPSQLADAAAANAKKFGNSAGTTNQPFYDLTRAGQSVLPSQLADSGTARRLAVQGGVGLGLGTIGLGGGYAANGTDGAQTAGATTLGLGTLLALGGTRAGQRAVTRTLLDRPDYLRRLGNEVIRRNGLGGMFGAGAALPLLTYD